MAQAAEAVGRCERTCARWLALPDVRARLSEAQAERFRVLGAMLAGKAAEAVGVLGTIMGDAQAPKSARVSAARGLLDVALRVAEFADLEQRLAALEARDLQRVT